MKAPLLVASVILLALCPSVPNAPAAESRPSRRQPSLRDSTQSRVNLPSYVPTKNAGPVEWKDGKVISRVLPYPDFVSLFIRLPVAHSVVTGRGVEVAVIQLSRGGSVSRMIEYMAPDARVATYIPRPGENPEERLADRIIKDGCRIAVIPDLRAWSAEAADALGKHLLAGNVLVIIPSDHSEETEKIEVVNALQAAGALAVGRTDQQSLVVEDRGGMRVPFNSKIRKIQTDVFCTVGVHPDTMPTYPVAAASGVAALTLEKWPDLSCGDVKKKITGGARYVWQASSVETGRWQQLFSVDPITTEYTPTSESRIFRFRVLDAAGALEVETAIPWPYNMLNLQKAWEISKGEGVTAVVSDQGFHIKHPQLAGFIKSEVHFGPRTFNSAGQDYHGTDMARILLAIAPEAKIIPALCSSASPADESQLALNVAKSLDYAVEQEADVFTASWGGWLNKNEDLLSAARSAVDRGVVVSWLQYPKAYPGLLRPGFTYLASGDGKSISFADRFLTDPPSFHPVEITAGLSRMAPQAAGIAALVISVDPELTPVQIEKLILKNSTPIGNGVLIPDAHEILLDAKRTANNGE